MTNSTFSGASLLVRYALRRDRIFVSLWGIALVGVCYASAAATGPLYPSVGAQVSAAEAINATPAIVALYGPILDVRSLGELAMTKMTVLYAVFAAAAFIVLVRRHTRTEEERGQTELVGGTAVGRNAHLASAVLESGALAFVLGLLIAAVNIAGGLPAAGSVAFGATWFGVGLVAIGISAVSCQLSASARTCGAIAASALIVAYALRAVGDISVSWLSWLSPFGWATRTRAYSDTRWWVLALYLGLAAILVAGAQLLRARRDLGSGLIAARPGPRSASRRLDSAIALAIRIQLPAITIWSAATIVLGAVMGAIVPNVSGLLSSPAASDMLARLGGEGGIERSLISAELSIAAVAVSCFGIAVVAHSASDEAAGRTELMLASATSRARSFLGTMLVAFVGAAWMLVLTGVAIALGYGGATGEVRRAFSEALPGAVAQLPAASVVVALAAAAFALKATWTGAGWVFVALFVTAGQVSELLNLPEWVSELSPYTHTPMPVAAFSPGSELALIGIVSVLLGFGWLRYRSRDIG